MDNITHSLFGWAIGRALPHQRWGRWVAPVSIFAANLPDLETFVVPRADKADYLLHHRGWGHSFLGVAVGSVLVAAAIWALGRWQPNRFAENARPTFGRALAVVAPCALSHLLLDWWNTYGIRPFFPFDSGWYYGDMVFIIDGWIWLMLLASVGLGMRWKPADPTQETEDPTPFRLVPAVAVALSGLFMAGVVALTASAQIVPPAATALWFVAAAGLVVCRWRLVRVIRPRFWAAAGLVTVGFYVGALAAISHNAHRAGLKAHAAEQRPAAVDSSANPVPGVPWRREVLVETDGRVYRYTVNGLRGTVTAESSLPNRLDDPVLEKLKQTKTYRAWKSFARHPVLRRDGRTLWLGDARYGLNSNRPDWSALKVADPGASP